MSELAGKRVKSNSFCHPEAAKRPKDLSFRFFVGLRPPQNDNPLTRLPANPLTKLGFTLIEVLVAATIAVIVVTAIMAVFASGVRVFERLRDYSDARADILLSLEQVERDSKNILNIPQIKFKGEPSRVIFPALAGGLPGSVSYYVEDGRLVKEEKDYSAATALDDSGKGAVTVLAAADEVTFSYYDYDPLTKSYSWKDTWESEDESDLLGASASRLGSAKKTTANKEISINTPLGIRIEVRYNNRGESAVLKRTVFYPSASSLRMAESESEKRKG